MISQDDLKIEEDSSRTVASPLPQENRDKTHCVHGHEFTPENTHLRYDKRAKKPYRSCKMCKTIHSKRASERSKELLKALRAQKKNQFSPFSE
jgi:hypothetical protein